MSKMKRMMTFLCMFSVITNLSLHVALGEGERLSTIIERDPEDRREQSDSSSNDRQESANPAVGAAAGAAIAAVVVTAIAGLVSWVDDQSDDTYAAALGAVWGKDCNLVKLEETATGYSWSSADGDVDTSCGLGHGHGYANEPYFEPDNIIVTTVAETWPLHAEIGEDFHAARAWAKAGVDGTTRVREECTPPDCGGSDPFNPPLWNPGDVIVRVEIPSLEIQTVYRPNDPSSSSTTSWRIEAAVDGNTILYTAGILDGHGIVSVQGDLDPALFTPSLNSQDGIWEIQLSGFVYEMLLTTLGPGEEIIVNTTLEGELVSNDKINEPGVDLFGACCEEDGSCSEDVAESDCGSLFSFFHPGQICEEISPCPQHAVGACYDAESGECIDDVYEHDCVSHSFAEGVSCSDLQFGACCVGDESYTSCMSTTEMNCLSEDGNYAGDGTLCLGDQDGDGVDDACAEPAICVTDLNTDGSTNAGDLAITLGSWGPCEQCAADFDGNGVVNAGDLAVVLGSWGECPQSAVCGDGVVDEFEECDPPDGELCDENCLFIDPPPCSCGCDLNCDGIITDEELLECEDLCGPGGICGDGVVGEGEQCDPPDGVTCDADCQIITGACDYPDIRTIVADADLDPPDIQQNYDAINATLHLFGGMTFESFFFEPLDVLSSVALERVETLETCAGVPIDAAMVASALQQIMAVGKGLPLVEVVASVPGELEEIKAAIDELRMQGIGFPPVATADSDVALILASVITLVDEAGVLEYGDYFFKDDSEVTEAQLAAITQANDEGGVLDFQVIDVENMTLKRTVRNDHCCNRGGCEPIPSLDQCEVMTGKWCGLPHVPANQNCGRCSVGSGRCS